MLGRHGGGGSPELKLLVDLEHTLGCGQAHRWRSVSGRWRGVIGHSVVELWVEDGVVQIEGETATRMARYLRADDDLLAVYQDIAADPFVSELVGRLHGLRLLRQLPWECMATYVLATNANIPRIRSMVENICRTFGNEVGDGQYSFPSPEQILEHSEDAKACGLGYRCDRLLALAHVVHEGRLDLISLKEMGHEKCIAELKKQPGIGDKVADCVALFSLDHLDAFPVDVRIRRCLGDHYGVHGSYKALRAFGHERFGQYCGYAQEFLFLDQA